MSAEALPYLVRSVSETIAVADCIQQAIDASRSDADAVDIVRDTALTVSALDRVLSEFVAKLLSDVSIRQVSAVTPLPRLLELLRSVPPSTPWKRLPAGGIISLLYHLGSALEDTRVSLQRLSRSRWDRTSTYAYPAGALLLFIVLRFTRLRNWKLRRWSSFFLGIAVARLYTAINDRVSARVRLQKLNNQLLILLRMWMIATDTVASANVNRNKSYHVMVSALSDQDFDFDSKTVARKLLESTSLPRGAAIWPTKSIPLGALKRGLDLVYSALEPGYYALQGGGILGSLIVLPVTAAAFMYYIAQPKAAAERAAALMVHPDVNYIKHVWRLTNTPLACMFAQAMRPHVALFESHTIEGIECNFVGNASVDVATAAPILACAPSDRRAAPHSAARSTLPTIVDEDEGLEAKDAAGPSDGQLARQLAPLSAVRHHVLPSSDRLPTLAEIGTPKYTGLDTIPSTPSSPVAGSLPPTLMYIHGGGFVGSFWANDSVFLSEWARKTGPDVAICFPHYSLSPEARYPVALNELLKVYLWLRKRSPRVAIAGESAGGNLATALVLRLIAEELPLPDGLVLCYPALCLNASPSPSRALHMNDPLVPVQLLLKLAGAYMPKTNEPSVQHPYIGSPDYDRTPTDPVSLTESSSSPLRADNGGENAYIRHLHDSITNPYVHPLYAPDDMLRKFPTTHIMVGGLDPLLDDAIDFNTRLRRLGIAGDLQVHRSLPHGFLYFPFVDDAPAAIEIMRSYCMDLLHPSAS